MKLYVKLLLFLFIVNSAISQNEWKLNNGIIYPKNKAYSLSLREGYLSGLRLGYTTRTDSGWVRYLNGVVQFYDGGAWRTISTTADSVNSPRNVLEVAKAGKKYNSIQTAINDFVYGDVILVYAGTYSDNLTIADSGVTIVGLDKKNTRISGTVTITGKDCRLTGLRIDGVFTLNCQSAYSLHKWSQFTDCIFANDVFIGSSTVENVYSWDFQDCNLIGYQDTLLINQTGAWQAHTVFQRGNIFSDTGGTEPYGGGYHLMLYGGGYVRFQECPTLLFESVNFDCVDSTIILELEKARTVLIGSGNINASNNSTNYAVLSMNYGLIGNWNNTNTWTFSNKFEVDFRWCSLTIPNIVWNSTANSRWEYCEQRGYLSASTLSGTGLSKLYLTNNIFRMDAPTGLGANAGNRWSAFIDD